MSNKKQRKILFWAYFWKSFRFVSIIPLFIGEIGWIISALCLAACGIYCILGVKFRWQSAHCIAQTMGRMITGDIGEMKPSNYAGTEDEKKNMIGSGITDMVVAVMFAVVPIVSLLYIR